MVYLLYLLFSASKNIKRAIRLLIPHIASIQRRVLQQFDARLKPVSNKKSVKKCTATLKR